MLQLAGSETQVKIAYFLLSGPLSQFLLSSETWYRNPGQEIVYL